MRKGERIREGVREGEGGSEGGETVLMDGLRLGLEFVECPPPDLDCILTHFSFFQGHYWVGGKTRLVCELINESGGFSMFKNCFRNDCFR